MFRASDKDLLSSMLINDMVSGSLKSYDELGYKNDLLARSECLLRTKRSWGILAKRRILFEGLELWYRELLSLCNIFTTGLSREEPDRYFA